jgi:hypothetical protein
MTSPSVSRWSTPKSFSTLSPTTLPGVGVARPRQYLHCPHLRLLQDAPEDGMAVKVNLLKERNVIEYFNWSLT